MTELDLFPGEKPADPPSAATPPAPGAAAGLVQGTTVILRLKSSALTGGLGNPVLATGELAGSALMSLLAILLPLLGLFLLAAGMVVTFRLSGRLLFGRRPG